MKDQPSRKTDLLDNDDRLDLSIDFGQLTDQPGASIVLDLVGNWNTPDEADTANPSQFVNPSSLIDPLQDSISGLARIDSPTFVPERELVGSLFANSVQSPGAHGIPAGRLRLPGPGGEIFGFQLLHLLGTGSFAKVYLARQGDLADRPVVLKISAIEGTEPQTLAQLQHTNVVPIYSVHEDAERGLRAVCMPYFGGAALSKVLHYVWLDKQIPVNGQVLLEALDRAAVPDSVTRIGQPQKSGAPENQESPTQLSVHTARNTISRMPYVQACAWIIGRLAEGLHHSHERNVIHRDIKPSNILLNAEGQPLLLDFNVSQLIDCDPDDASLGGTIAYMAPEHLRAAISRDSASMMLVDHRSDVYSLGLVLYEMLTGASPFERATNATMSPSHLTTILTERERTVPSLKRNAKLDIPWSLESIVRKTLAPEPKDRYETAAQLSEDLNRFLEDQTLKFAPELSRWEQAQKWVRRHPRLKTTALVTFAALLLIIPGGITLGMTRNDLAKSVEELNLAAAIQKGLEFEEQTAESLSQVNIHTPNEDTLHEGISACRKTLAIFGVIEHPDWQSRGHWRYLSYDKRRALGEHVRELLLSLAGAELRAAADRDQATAQALDLLKIAERIRGLPPSRALWIDRARYLTLRKDVAQAEQARQQAEQTPANSAYDKYMLASALAREGSPASLQEAIRLLSQSIKLDPTHYWSHFERALCQEQLGEHFLAAADLGTCIGLWPKSSWAHFNLGFLFDEQGRKAKAVEAYTEALKYARDFQSAYFNRGLALLELREYRRALNDFETAGKLGRNDAVWLASRAMAFEGLGQTAEADREFAKALQHAENIPGSPKGRISWTHAFAIAHRAPQISQQIFEDILRTNPKHAQALYGQGMLLMRKGQMQGAIRSFDKAIAADSNFVEPIRYRAISLARIGELEPAAADVDVFTAKEPTNPESYYAAACVAALSARKTGDRLLVDHALEMLQRALVYVSPEDRTAFQERAAEDDDLSILRSDPLFQELTGTGDGQTKSRTPKDI